MCILFTAVVWGFALYFFFQGLSTWQVTCRSHFGFIYDVVCCTNPNPVCLLLFWHRKRQQSLVSIIGTVSCCHSLTTTTFGISSPPLLCLDLSWYEHCVFCSFGSPDMWHIYSKPDSIFSFKLFTSQKTAIFSPLLFPLRSFWPWTMTSTPSRETKSTSFRFVRSSVRSSARPLPYHLSSLVCIFSTFSKGAAS